MDKFWFFVREDHSRGFESVQFDTEDERRKRLSVKRLPLSIPPSRWFDDVRPNDYVVLCIDALQKPIHSSYDVEWNDFFSHARKKVGDRVYLLLRGVDRLDNPDLSILQSPFVRNFDRRGKAFFWEYLGTVHDKHKIALLLDLIEKETPIITVSRGKPTLNNWRNWDWKTWASLALIPLLISLAVPYFLNQTVKEKTDILNRTHQRLGKWEDLLALYADLSLVTNRLYTELENFREKDLELHQAYQQLRSEIELTRRNEDDAVDSTDKNLFSQHRKDYESRLHEIVDQIKDLHKDFDSKKEQYRTLRARENYLEDIISKKAIDTVDRNYLGEIRQMIPV